MQQHKLTFVTDSIKVLNSGGGLSAFLQQKSTKLHLYKEFKELNSIKSSVIDR